MGCCRETFACCKLRCKLADLGQCLADRFRDPQRLSAYAAHIFCTLYRPLRRIENDSGAESWSWRLSPSRAGARLTAAAGKSCGFVVATDLRRGPGTLGNALFPSHERAIGPADFCRCGTSPSRAGPGISSRSKDIVHAICHCGWDPYFPGANALLEIPARNHATFQKNNAIPAGGPMMLYRETP